MFFVQLFFVNYWVALQKFWSIFLPLSDFSKSFLIQPFFLGEQLIFTKKLDKKAIYFYNRFLCVFFTKVIMTQSEEAQAEGLLLCILNDVSDHGFKFSLASTLFADPSKTCTTLFDPLIEFSEKEILTKLRQENFTLETHDDRMPSTHRASLEFPSNFQEACFQLFETKYAAHRHLFSQYLIRGITIIDFFQEPNSLCSQFAFSKWNTNRLLHVQQLQLTENDNTILRLKFRLSHAESSLALVKKESAEKIAALEKALGKKVTAAEKAAEKVAAEKAAEKVAAE